MMIVGYGALVLPVASIVWGTRLSCMRGRTVPCRACSSCRSSWRWRRSTRPATCRHRMDAFLRSWRVVRRYRSRRGSERAAHVGEPGLKLIAAAAFLGGARMLMHVAGISPGSSGRRCGSSSTGCFDGCHDRCRRLRGVGTGVGKAAGRSGRADRAAGGPPRRYHGASRTRRRYARSPDGRRLNPTLLRRHRDS
jgi:hypothetical protein